MFGDRLINDKDRNFLLEFLRQTLRSRFGLNFDNVFAHLDKATQNGQKDGKVDSLDEIRGLMFTNVMTPVGADKRPYHEIMEFSLLEQALQKTLEDYNTFADKPMDLVLFNFAVEHLLIISRILSQPGGNALLVGVGGSGR